MEKAPKVAVVIHAHHLDVLEEILYHLESIPGEFDLFLNFSYISKQNEKYILDIEEVLKKSIPGKCYFTTSDNRGQDLGGFFASTKKAKENNLSYNFVCKVHTKKNENKMIKAFHTTRTWWRQRLLKSLLGNVNQVESIFKIFKTYPNVGMICDHKFYCKMWEPKNKPSYDFFVNKLQLKKEACYPNNLHFLAGTMFWMRGDVWDFLMDKDITIKDFEIGSASDGLRSHAFERVFDAVVRHLDYGVWLLGK